MNNRDHEEDVREESRADTVDWIRQADDLHDIKAALEDWERESANDCLDGDAIGDIIDESGVVEALGLRLPSDLPEYIEGVVGRDTTVLFDPRSNEVLDYDGGFSVYSVDMDVVAARAMKRANSLQAVAEAIGYVDEVFPLGEYEDAIDRIGAFDVTDPTGNVYCAKSASGGSYDVVCATDGGRAVVRTLAREDAPKCVLDAEPEVLRVYNIVK